VIVVAVEQALQHCPKALVRSDLWKLATEVSLRPSQRSATFRLRAILASTAVSSMPTRLSASQKNSIDD
jgi:hypothetical protein